MAVFGEKWNNHCERIFENWSNTVSREDLVLIPGDICWAMQLNDAIDDINKLSALPGTKLLLRGNHDYWWSSLAKMQSMFPEDVHIIQNDLLFTGILRLPERADGCILRLPGIQKRMRKSIIESLFVWSSRSHRQCEG